MEGVEILSQTAIYESQHVVLCFMTSIIVCSIIFCIVGYVGDGLFEGILYAFLGAVIGLIIGIIIGAMAYFCTAKPTGKYTYKVTADDSVKLNEFYDNYEIIDQDGKIFEVKLRES